MTTWKVDSKDEAFFVQKVAIKYLSVLNAEGLVGFINLVAEEGHEDSMWDFYNEVNVMEQEAPFVCRVNSARLCAKARSYIMEHLICEVNGEYYVPLSSFDNKKDSHLFITDENGGLFQIERALRDLG